MKGTASDNFDVEKSACKSVQNLHRIHKNGAQNLQVTCAEFAFFLLQNSYSPSYGTIVPAVHLFSLKWLIGGKIHRVRVVGLGLGYVIRESIGLLV